MKNGIIYTRVSTKEQVEGHTSLGSQERECQEYARKHDLVVTEDRIFREKGESGKIVDRTELQNLLAFVKEQRNKGKNPVDVLLIWKIDRLSRNLGDYYGIKIALDRLGVKVVSVTEPLTDDPVGRFLEAILAAAAQFDNEIRTIRTTGGMRVTVEQGGWPHDAPIGYIKKDKRVVIDPKFGPIIKEALELFSTGGYTLEDMSRWLHERGVETKSGKRRPGWTIKANLMNMLYAGYTASTLTGGKLYKGKHKALVPEAVIKKNIELIEGNKKPFSFKDDDLYPLKNILLCVTCGKNLTAAAPTGRSGKGFPRYYCNRSTCTKGVTGRSVVSKDITLAHEDFRALLASQKPLHTGIAELWKQVVVRTWNEEYKKTLQSVIDLERARQDKLNYNVMIDEKYIKDKITEAEKDHQKKIVANDISSIEEDLEEQKQFLEENQAIIDKAMDFIKDPEVFWNRASTPVKKVMQQFLFPNGIPYDFETGYGTIQTVESYLLIKKMADKSAENPNVVVPTRIELVTSSL